MNTLNYIDMHMIYYQRQNYNIYLGKHKDASDTALGRK